MPNNIYQAWLLSVDLLKQAKKDELELRNKICGELLVGKLEGSLTKHDQGYKVVPTAKLTRTIDKPMLEAIWDDLSDKEKECIVYKPSLVLANYKIIEAEGGTLLDAVTVKPAQSSLKIIPLESDS